MESEYGVPQKEENGFLEQPSPPEFIWKNLVIGIAVVVVVIFFIFLGISQGIKSSDYKSMDLSTKKQEGSVAGASAYGPDKPTGVIQPTKTPNPTPTTAAATPQPTAAPTSQPEPTATPTHVPPTAAPTAAEPTPDPTPSEEPSPTDVTPTNEP